METFKNKRILFICRETYSKPLWFLAKEYSKDNEVGAFYIMSTESCYNKCKYNENTIYQFREKLPQVKFYDVSDICKKFTEDLKSKPKKRSTSKHPWKNYKSPVDLDYLKDIEENYTHFKNLNLQLMSSQENTKHYHWRYYWQVQDFDENLYWLELNYRKIISVIEDFKPDMILDFDNAELQRTIINEVAYKKNIPYITIEYSKFGFYKFPTLQNTIGIDEYVKNRYEENLKKSPEELSEMYDYIKDFRAKSSIMSKEFAGTVTSKYEKDSIKSILKEMLAKYIYFYDEDIRANNRPIKKSDKRLFPDTHLNLKHFWQVQLLRRKFMALNDVFENPVEGEDYVYMPLHLIPESTVFIKGSFFVDELSLIEQVSKALPIGWKLYVKEHQAMLGERGVEFYEKVRELHNVRLVQINYYHDPKPWINNAKGVVTIVGTTAYEEALFGKRSIIFGDVPFNLIDGVEKITDFSKLPEAIRQFGEIDNIHSCAAYLQTVKDVGFEWDLFYVMDKADKILGGKEEMDEKFSKDLETINEFYKAGYRHFEERRGK
ncbi:MAG: hypothetical protein Q4E51_01105 [Lachnospiraceae bacterium]|nr:hypothetical protein [Lachnospiraceae bacterium]